MQTLRRSAAGATLRGVAYMLGHKRMSTTDKYLAPDRAAGRAAIESGTKKKKKDLSEKAKQIVKGKNWEKLDFRIKWNADENHPDILTMIEIQLDIVETSYIENTLYAKGLKKAWKDWLDMLGSIWIGELSRDDQVNCNRTLKELTSAIKILEDGGINE